MRKRSRVLASLLIAANMDPVRAARALTRISDAMQDQQDPGFDVQPPVRRLTNQSAAFGICKGPLFQWLLNPCGSAYVKDVEGKMVRVSLKCFAKGGQKPDELAGFLTDGECFIPKGGQCDYDSQCRHGTSCLLDGDAYICQEVAADHTFDNATPAEVASSAATIIRSMAAILLQSELLVSDTSAGKFLDSRSGTLSPFVVKPALARQILPALAKSFQHATVKGKDAASRSGSLFIISGDKRFLAKSVRESEYEEFAHHLIGPLARHAGLADATCQTSSQASCWAKAALNHTSLNLPVLAFIHDARYWIVMASSAQLRGLAISGTEEDLEPWGPAKFYDVKPVWAKSAAREGFMQKLAELDIEPTAANAPAELQSQWAELQTTVNSDLDFLAREGADTAPFIDYSLLFEVYEPRRRVDVKHTHCLEAHPCFGPDPTNCRVLCVSIIDYLTRFTLDRMFESMWKKFKFHDYAEKTKQLLQCPLLQRFPRRAADRVKINGEVPTALPTDGVVRVETDVGFGGRYIDKGCTPYLHMACKGRVMDGQLQKRDCFYTTQGQQCHSGTCTWTVEARYLDLCSSWMQSNCGERLAWHNDLGGRFAD